MKMKIILSVLILIVVSMLIGLSVNHVATIPPARLAVAQLNGGDIERSTLDAVSNKQHLVQILTVVIGSILMISVWKPKSKKEKEIK